MLKLLLGDPNARKLKRYQPIVSDINLLEEEIAPFPTTNFVPKRLLPGASCQRRQTGRPTSDLDDILPEAFAVVREAGKRVLGMRHFDVQLIGGMKARRPDRRDENRRGQHLLPPCPAISMPSPAEEFTL